MNDPMIEIPVWVDDDDIVRIGAGTTPSWWSSIYVDPDLSDADVLAALRRVLPSTPTPDDGWTRDGDGWVRESTDVDELRAHHGRYGPGSVEFLADGWVVSLAADLGHWSSVVSLIPDDFRYRMVRPTEPAEPAPVLPDGAPPGAEPGPSWLPGTYIVPPDTAPVPGWDFEGDDGWWYPWPWDPVVRRSLVVRPTPEPEPEPEPDTEDVPLLKADGTPNVVGRTLPGEDEPIGFLQWSDGRAWKWDISHGGAYRWRRLPVNADGTVTVLRESDEGTEET